MGCPRKRWVKIDKNHQEALEFLYELIEHHKNNTITEHLIRQLHQLVVRDTQQDIAGKYRDGDVMIGGADHKPPNNVDIPLEMKKNDEGAIIACYL